MAGIRITYIPRAPAWRSCTRNTHCSYFATASSTGSCRKLLRDDAVLLRHYHENRCRRFTAVEAFFNERVQRLAIEARRAAAAPAARKHLGVVRELAAN